MALRGPNGVGKSTLIRALCGLIPSGGQATLGEFELGADGWLDNIAYTGHRDAIKAALSVIENLQFWADLYGGNADAALDRFDLSAIADRPAGLCSAGQKRRLGLARLALGDRQLWLLDEPTVSLDAQHTALFAGVLAQHLSRGGLAIIATHIDLGLDLRPHVLVPVTSSPSTESDPFLAGEFH